VFQKPSGLGLGAQELLDQALQLRVASTGPLQVGLAVILRRELQSL
jgi:hypothetical protein